MNFVYTLNKINVILYQSCRNLKLNISHELIMRVAESKMRGCYLFISTNVQHCLFVPTLLQIIKIKYVCNFVKLK